MFKSTFYFLCTTFILAFSGVSASSKTFNIPSEKMQRSFRCKVFLPRGYSDKKSYSQIYLLHGAGGDSSSWGDITKLEQYADKYQRIIICPTAGKSSWYTKNNMSENYIVEEVIPFIDNKYSTTNDRWITGFSMGGYGALSIGFKNPTLFKAIGGLSACIKPSKWTDKWDILKMMGEGSKKGEFDLFEDEETLAIIENDTIAFSLLCGDEDFFFEENRDAFIMLKHMGANVHWIKKLEGKHNSKFWRTNLKLQLEYFEKVTKKSKK